MQMTGRLRLVRHAPCYSLALLMALTLAGLTVRAAAATTFHVAVGPNGTISYSPNQVTIQVGDTVTWSNSSGIPHNVTADDGSFQCANGCNDTGGDPTPSGSWTASRTFTAAGVVHYHCQVHGFEMTGTVTVQGQAPPPPSPGALKLSNSGYGVGEAAGHATITVERSGGEDGAVSVQYATSDGTGKAGTDYTAASGTLSWADGDEANKTFTVPILNRHLSAPSKTVNLALSNPTGGATLGSPASALLTIAENTGGSGPPPVPAAPTNLLATPQSTSTIMLNWNEASAGVTEFHVEQQSLGGSFQEIDTVPGNSLTDLVSGLSPSTFYNFRVRALNGGGFSPYSNVAGAATNAVPTTCVPGGPNTLCLGDGGRFKVEVSFTSPTLSGMGNAVTVPSAPESGLFYFFNSGNIEMLVKVLNACSPPFNRYWVFYAATTNVQFTLTVTDTQTNRVRVYFNPSNQAAAPVQDTDAFATCP